MSQLTNRQRIAYNKLVEHGEWPSGWALGSVRETRKLLDALVAKGRARVEETTLYGFPVTRYVPIV